jgi:molybdate transport system substrate-binding protein
MLGSIMKLFIAVLFSFLMSNTAMAQLEVIISGGFSGPYKAMLPEFEKTTGIHVVTKSGASQGSGPKTIKAQLLSGTTADVVILSREGLEELVALGKIQAKSDVDLAQAPLGLAVPTGATKPNISTVNAFKSAVLKAKKIVIPGSTSGIYLNDELFPNLGIKNQLEIEVTERGSQATAVLAAKGANMAIQPSSELVDIPGIDYVGALPNEIQLIQTFTAAITTNSPHQEAAKKLIDYLSSPKATGPIQHGGMNPVR